jgi:MYXO-CTERM domain-containing protein
VLDQAECEGRWCKLLFPFGDRFKMVTGSSGYVQLTNLSGEAPSTRIAADAARFVKVDYPGDSDLPSGWAGAPCGSSNDCWGSLVCSEGGACASSCWTVGCAAPTVCEIATGLCIEPGAAMTPEDYLGDAPDGDDLFDDDDEDGGVEPGDGLDAGSFDPRSGDCGCSSGSDAPGWLGVLVVLGLAGRRRPRRRHVPA